MHAIPTHLRALRAAAVVLGLASTLAAAESKTFKVVMHSDLKALDPVWSGAYIVRNHGYLVYDTLFGTDEHFQVKPQMVDQATVSPDGISTLSHYEMA